MLSGSRDVRIGVVFSAGGLRGIAHLGVLRRLVQMSIPIHAIVGVSAGAIVAAFYAAVGLSVNEMIEIVPAFRARHLLMHGVTLRAHRIVKPYLRRFCGIIPERLEQLDRASFSTLHHGIERLGIVCHDHTTKRTRYFSSIEHHGVRLADVARASAAIPGVLPPKRMTIGGEQVCLADGGISDPLPVTFARSPALGATHIIASDCRYVVTDPLPHAPGVVYIRPAIERIGTLSAPRAALLQAVTQGEAAVTSDIAREIERWLRVPLAS